MVGRFVATQSVEKADDGGSGEGTYELSRSDKASAAAPSGPRPWCSQWNVLSLQWRV